MHRVGLRAGASTPPQREEEQSYSRRRAVRLLQPRIPRVARKMRPGADPERKRSAEAITRGMCGNCGKIINRYADLT
jgi:hypothetical protein